MKGFLFFKLKKKKTSEWERHVTPLEHINEYSNS